MNYQEAVTETISTDTFGHVFAHFLNDILHNGMHVSDLEEGVAISEKFSLLSDRNNSTEKPWLLFAGVARSALIQELKARIECIEKAEQSLSQKEQGSEMHQRIKDSIAAFSGFFAEKEEGGQS